MYNPKLSQPYLSIRGLYDATFDNPSEGFYNQLKGAMYEFKSTNWLPDNMYDSINNMQRNYGNQLGDLEKKLW